MGRATAWLDSAHSISPWPRILSSLIQYCAEFSVTFQWFKAIKNETVRNGHTKLPSGRILKKIRTGIIHIERILRQ
jgi:hypothetical protein